MLRFFINIILIIPFCVYSQEYKTDIDSLNAKAKQCIHIDLDSAYSFAEKAIKESQKYILIVSFLLNLNFYNFLKVD